MTDPTDAERLLARKLAQESSFCGGDLCVTPPCACVDDIALALASARAEGYRQGQEEMQERCAEVADRLVDQQAPISAVAAVIRALPITGAGNAK